MCMEKLTEWELAGEAEVFGEILPHCHIFHHKSHMTTWDRTRVAAVGNRRLTVSSTARPYYNYETGYIFLWNSVQLLLWRVLPLKTPFRLVIRFLTILQVVTTINFYTVTYLHSLQSIHPIIPILLGTSGIHLETADR
jgi:hypothetical protein